MSGFAGFDPTVGHGGGAVTFMDFMDEDIHASTTHTAPTAPVVAPVATVIAPDELAPNAPVVHLPVTPSEMGLETPPGGTGSE